MRTRFHWIISIRQQLIIVNLLVLGVLFLVGRVAASGLDSAELRTWSLVELANASSAFHYADMMHDAVRGDVLDRIDGGPGHAGTDLPRHTAELRRALAEAQEHWERAGMATPFPDLATLVDTYLADADHIVRTAAADPEAARALYPSFADRFVAVDRRMGGVTDTVLDPAVAEAAAGATATEARATTLIAAGAAVAGLALTALIWGVGSTLVARLQRLAAVAERMRSGSLEVRVSDLRDDEIGALGTSFNAMADGLSSLVRRHEGDAARTAFSARIANAMDLADTQTEAIAALERALKAITPQHPAELLLSDAAQSTLERAAHNQAAGAAGCAVEAPGGCIAVRRASVVVATDSEALDACPRLRGRAGGACSGVCVPLSFMGRAMGVIHVTGPQSRPPSPEMVDQLAVLAAQAGARIGTLRVAEQTHLQATTDPLTGLFNRRTVEERVRHLTAAHKRYSLAMADLDFFKKLNDTFGHDAGDRALRRFSQVLRECARAGDVVGRFGGEEFILVFPTTPVDGAVAVLERVRERMADPATRGSAPAVTASFGVVDVGAGESFEDAMKRADVALYRAKQAGRDRVVVAGDEGSAAAPRPDAMAG